MGDHIISFLDICAMRGQLVLAKAPSIPAINNRTVYCTGAHKHGEDRCIVLDGEEYSQILFVDGTIKLCWQRGKAMDNIIVNSALWFAEQSSQFLVNSGANKLLNKGYDYYVKEFIPLGHRLIQNGQIAADAMDGELAAQFSMAYVANYWRAAKTVYNFAPEFLRTLAETEDAPIYSDIMMRLPYRDFVVNNPRLKSRACISESTL